MATATLAPSEERVAGIMKTVRFLYPNEQYPHDEETVRAMMVLGGTDAQITEAIAVAAINMRVDRESKTRYAAGVLRNLMDPPEPDDGYAFDDPDDPDDYRQGRIRRWLFSRQHDGFDDSVHG